MDLREIGWGSVDWIQLAQDRDRWRALVNGDEPSCSGATELVIPDFLICWLDHCCSQIFNYIYSYPIANNMQTSCNTMKPQSINVVSYIRPQPGRQEVAQSEA
jgi:hypothetical protein